MKETLQEEIIGFAREAVDRLCELEDGWVPLRKVERRVVEQDLGWLKRDLEDCLKGGADVEEVLDVLLQLGGILFCVGARKEDWKTIWQLVGEGYYELRDCDFLPYCILGGGTDFIQRKPWMQDALSMKLANFRGLLAVLLGDAGILNLVDGGEEDGDDDYARACACLVGGDVEGSVPYLKGVARYWMLEDTLWDGYESGFAPMFEPYACALVALYRRQGGDVGVFSEDERRFYIVALV